MGKYLENKNEIYHGDGLRRCFAQVPRRHDLRVLEVTDELRGIILNKPTIAEIKRVIEQGHFTTLTQSGWMLVAGLHDARGGRSGVGGVVTRGR